MKILSITLLGLALLASAATAQVDDDDDGDIDGGPGVSEPAAPGTGNESKPVPHGGIGRNGHGPLGFGPRLTAEEREKLKTMTPEERKAFYKEKRKAWLATLTPEQRKKIEERQAARKAKLEAMTPEQRAELKERRAQRRGGLGFGGRGEGGRGGGRRGGAGRQ